MHNPEKLERYLNKSLEYCERVEKEYQLYLENSSFDSNEIKQLIFANNIIKQKLIEAIEILELTND